MKQSIFENILLILIDVIKDSYYIHFNLHYMFTENEKGPDKENENTGGKPGGKPVKEIKGNTQ